MGPGDLCGVYMLVCVCGKILIEMLCEKQMMFVGENVVQEWDSGGGEVVFYGKTIQVFVLQVDLEKLILACNKISHISPSIANLQSRFIKLRFQSRVIKLKEFFAHKKLLVLLSKSA